MSEDVCVWEFYLRETTTVCYERGLQSVLRMKENRSDKEIKEY